MQLFSHRNAGFYSVLKQAQYVQIYYFSNYGGTVLYLYVLYMLYVHYIYAYSGVVL